MAAMEIETLLFGPAADAAGADRITLALPEEATVADALAAIARQYPVLAAAVEGGGGGGGRLAVNHEYAPAHRRLAPTDEVALISLVSGG
jgi:molybdopterin converting factor small subunit